MVIAQGELELLLPREERILADLGEPGREAVAWNELAAGLVDLGDDDGLEDGRVGGVVISAHAP